MYKTTALIETQHLRAEDCTQTMIARRVRTGNEV